MKRLNKKQRVLFALLTLVIEVPVFTGMVYLLDLQLDRRAWLACILACIAVSVFSDLFFMKKARANKVVN